MSSEEPFGRPLIPIDWKRAEKLMKVGCSGPKIAAVFGMHSDTFYDRVQKHYSATFTVISALKRAEGDTMIEEAQFDKAVNDKDNTMLIWLGKTRLEQREPEARAHVEVVQAFDNTLEIVKPSRKEEAHPTPKCSDDRS